MWQCLCTQNNQTTYFLFQQKKAVTTLHGTEDLDIAPLNFYFFWNLES